VWIYNAFPQFVKRILPVENRIYNYILHTATENLLLANIRLAGLS